MGEMFDMDCWIHLTALYKSALSAYSELLFNWGYLNQRTEVAKHGSTQKFGDTPVGSLCGECGELVTGIYCDTCNQRSLTCSVCRGHVMGLSVTCPKCGHGGHLKHFREWF